MAFIITETLPRAQIDLVKKLMRPKVQRPPWACRTGSKRRLRRRSRV